VGEVGRVNKQGGIDTQANDENRESKGTQGRRWIHEAEREREKDIIEC
jgi:hypothetical protein